MSWSSSPASRLHCKHHSFNLPGSKVLSIVIRHLMVSSLTWSHLSESLAHIVPPYCSALHQLLLFLAAGFWPLHLRSVALDVLLQRRLCLARFQVFRCSEWIPFCGADAQCTVGRIPLLSFTHFDLSLKRDWSGQGPRLFSFHPPLVYF